VKGKGEKKGFEGRNNRRPVTLGGEKFGLIGRQDGLKGARME